MIYYLLYILFSFLGLKFTLWYCVILLDVTQRIPTIEDILKSVYVNYKLLLYTALFGLIIIYLFSVLAFQNFYEYYVDNNDNLPFKTYCTDLWDCFYSTIIVGLRAGGGIGDGINQAGKNDQNFEGRFIFDLCFFILVNIILLNVIFGIIIDTFAQLRDERNDRERNLTSQCFVCGIRKTLFDLHGNGFLRHKSIEHNVYAYLAFIIYIRNKEMNECNGIEKFVKKKILSNDPSFMPNSALCFKHLGEQMFVTDNSQDQENQQNT